MSKIIKISDDTFDTQLEKLPKDVVFCNKCVVSNQRPRIKFNLKVEPVSTQIIPRDSKD